MSARITCLARLIMRPNLAWPNNSRAAYTMIDGPQAGITFFASDDPHHTVSVGSTIHVTYSPDDQYARRATVGEWFTARVVAVMQEADEITTNLPIDEYITAMRAIAEEATRRADTAERNRS